MKGIDLIQVGLGPLGRMITRFAHERACFRIVGAVDPDPAIAGRTLGQLCGIDGLDVVVQSSLQAALRGVRPAAAVLATVSSLTRLAPQLEELLACGLPVVSTCEQLVYPWFTQPQLAEAIDRQARRHKVAVLGTGVNPGFMMDALPVCLTAVAQEVQAVRVKRLQDAAFRRIPFQRKIGAGLSLEQFEAERSAGTLRHVGLTESMHLLAARMGWRLERTEEVLTPVVASARIASEALTIEPGQAAGVQQIGRGFAAGKERITLTFRAAIGEPAPEDTVEIDGRPPFVSTIRGGINGDAATCAITLNAVPRLLEAGPGLKTMLDIPLVSYCA